MEADLFWLLLEGNSHIPAEIGVAGDYIRKEYLPCLDNPEQLRENPRRLIQELKNAFEASAKYPEKEIIINAGGYLPSLALLHPERMKVILEEMVDSLRRKFGKAVNLTKRN